MTNPADEIAAVDRPKRTDKVRSHPKSPQSGAADAVLERGRPWYFDAPSVLYACARISFVPFSLVIRIAEAAVALAVCALLALIYGWYSGMILDRDVVAFLRPIGQRILAMIQQSGAMP